jgi:hypothetical protein
VLAMLPRGGSKSEWSVKTTSAWNTLIHRLKKEERSHSRDHTSRDHKRKSSARRRPSSAAARLRATPEETAKAPQVARASTAPVSPNTSGVVARTADKAACGGAAQAVRAARARPSSAVSAGRKRTS